MKNKDLLEQLLRSAARAENAAQLPDEELSSALETRILAARRQTDAPDEPFLFLPLFRAAFACATMVCAAVRPLSLLRNAKNGRLSSFAQLHHQFSHGEMNPMTRGKMIVYLAAIFGKRLLVSGLIGYQLNWRRGFRPPKPQEMAEHIRQRLVSRLELTPAQIEAIDPILKKTSRDFQDLSMQTRKKMDEVIACGNAAIMEKLSPEQKVRFEAMEREHHSPMHKHPAGPGP